MYDIQMMIMNNTLFKNLDSRDQKVLQKLIYRAEMTEMFIRDRSLMRINESFEKIIEDVLDKMDAEDPENRARGEEDEDY
jgi:hypothetical protein